MAGNPKPLPQNAPGIWQRSRGHDQSTAEIARRTGLPEPEVEEVIFRCLQARYDNAPMPWMASA